MYPASILKDPFGPCNASAVKSLVGEKHHCTYIVTANMRNVCENSSTTVSIDRLALPVASASSSDAAVLAHRNLSTTEEVVSESRPAPSSITMHRDLALFGLPVEIHAALCTWGPYLLRTNEMRFQCLKIDNISIAEVSQG
jgi:hypothetical protein